MTEFVPATFGLEGEVTITKSIVFLPVIKISGRIRFSKGDKIVLLYKKKSDTNSLHLKETL